MKINIKTLEVKLTPAMKAYVEKKLGTLKKVLVSSEIADSVLANVEIGKTTKHHHSGQFFKAEVHLLASGKKFNGSFVAEDLYAAIDKVKDELEREIVNKKDRAQTLTHRGGRKIKKMLKGLKKFEHKL